MGAPVLSQVDIITPKGEYETFFISSKRVALRGGAARVRSDVVIVNQSTHASSSHKGLTAVQVFNLMASYQK